MSRHLLFAVHLYADGMGTARYHGISQGAPEWPPAPARVFQALVAGVARGLALPDSVQPALQWLERLPPPLIAAPPRVVGQAVSFYVPNNDADALADPSDVSSIRTAKLVQPSLFDGVQPILYAWPLPDETPDVEPLIKAAQSVYQLGRGVDMAWADAQVLEDDALHERLGRYRGHVHRPSPGGVGGPGALACPVVGSLASLVLRHRATRLRVEGAGKKARVLFTNPPKPRFAAVGYAATQRLKVYELRERGSTKPWPWALNRAASLVEQVRDAAAARLIAALGAPSAANIERCLIGRAPDGSGSVPLAQRVRILPLPSIGAAHADQAIRRIVVEIPGACPIAADDLDWAFSGLDRVDHETGELSPWMLTAADSHDMLDHYTSPSRHWQSVTAVALPEAAGRRRIDPARMHEQAKSADERQREEGRAIAAVHTALRHAGLTMPAETVKVQREPFNSLSQRAESWGADTRFAKERLWHVALAFEQPVRGPLAIGDGRFLGLGVLAPSSAAQGKPAEPAAALGLRTDGVFAIQSSEVPVADATRALAMARALRRAVLSRVLGRDERVASAGLARYVSGHVEAGTGADEREGGQRAGAPDDQASQHLAFHWDPPRARWLVLAPHCLQHRSALRWERLHLSAIDQALEGLSTLLAGRSGRHAVQRVSLKVSDPVLVTAYVWESVTPYTVTRHRRLSSAGDALAADVRAECQRCGLPMPEVEVQHARSVPGQGLQGFLRLRFSVAVAGPVALGRTGLLGGGLFAAATSGSLGSVF